MIFVTYSWVNEKPDNNVLQLVAILREKGYEAVCDIILSQQETAIHFTRMMAENLKRADKVVIVLSEKYKEKADSFKGGVGTEYQYIIDDIERNKNKYILVTFEIDREKVTPDFLHGRDILFLNKDAIVCDNLLHKILGTGYSFPPVNEKRTLPMTIPIYPESTNDTPTNFEKDKRIPEEVHSKLLQGEKVKLFFTREENGFFSPYIGYFFTDRRIIYRDETQQSYTNIFYSDIKTVDCLLNEWGGIIHGKLSVLNIKLSTGDNYTFRFKKAEDAEKAEKFVIERRK